ncbi:MAG: hypothetical protein IH594_00020 [Bacteroidales bacterium]|nr:hypothetical protein [Bacteroidales bacterium]
MPDYQVRHQMMKLSRLGFIYYDDKKDQITLLDKLFYFIEASVGRTDYDVILFESNIRAPGENATLNLDSHDLTIFGIPNIFLSDSQNVALIPAQNKIIMKRNKSFQFDGSIQAGLFTMYGNNFFFEYDSFKVNLQDVDSLRVRLKIENRNTGRLDIINIENLIQNLTGEIIIDNPSNKSGLENYPEYPIFRSIENSYVYFDDPSIQGGVYDKNKVFFELAPFEIDSLDNFTREGMELAGVFQSDGLLPPLEQTLTLRADNSLGFVYRTPQTGLPVYDGRGVFYNELEMSSRGLHGAGQLDYLTSTTFSDDFTFHPDSLMSNSREFMIRKKSDATAYPSVSSRNSRVKWYSKKDEFNAFMTDVPFTMFSDTVRLEGDLLLEPEGLSGKGKMDLVTSAVISKEFRYGDEQIKADSAGFRLNSPLSDKLAISTSNVRANIDFQTMKGQFYANEDYSRVEFPEILYSSNLDFFEWELEDENVKMGLNRDITSGIGEDGLSGPRYFSLLPSQDSLNFVSPLAVYDYKAGELTATEVPYIQVADARIYPVDGQITVAKNAVMRQLADATIVADYRTEDHRILNAGVSINGRYDYTASGDYEYKDITGEVQMIHFNKISVNDSVYTQASGEIALEDNFSLSPHFDFQGQVFLAARDPYLLFRGGARIQHDCGMGRQWLKFESSIDPANVMIPVTETPLQVDMAPTYVGTMITRDSTHVYSTFISRRKDYFDKPITTANGFLRFEPTAGRYEIASAGKLENRTLQGNYLALDPSSCMVYGEGKLDLQLDFGQVKMQTFGEAEHNIPDDSFNSRLMMTLDFLFSPDALELFAHDLDSLPGIQPMDITDRFYRQAMREMIGVTAAERLEADLGLYAEYRTIPPGLLKTLVLSDVKLAWNQYTRSYRYEGEISIVRIGNKMVNRKVNAIIEMTKRASGDLLDIYLVLDDNNWYYFGYNPGSLQVVSSNRVFNNLVFELKAKDRKLKTRMGDTGYIYSLASERRLQLFLRRFNAGDEGEQYQ